MKETEEKQEKQEKDNSEIFSASFDQENITHSVLHVYDLGNEGNSFEKIGELNEENISEEFNKFHFSQKCENGFIISDIFPLCRKYSKYFHLIITTKNGYRAYISLNTEIDNSPINNEVDKLIRNKNSIYRHRPTMNWSFSIKIIPENFINTDDRGFEMLSNRNFQTPYNPFEKRENEFYSQSQNFNKFFEYKNSNFNNSDSNVFNYLYLKEKSKEKKLQENKMFFLDQKFVIFYKDDLKKRSFLDLLEFEEKGLEKFKLQNQDNDREENFDGKNFEENSNGKNLERKYEKSMGRNYGPNFAQNFSSSNFPKNLRKNIEGNSIENIFNLINFDYRKEVFGFYRNYTSNNNEIFHNKNSKITNITDNISDLSYLYKNKNPLEKKSLLNGFNINNQGGENFIEKQKKFSEFLKIPSDKNFMDSDSKTSIEYMNNISKQIFENDEKYIILTSGEIIFFNKIRPIDKLYKIIISYLDQENINNSNFNNINKGLSPEFLDFLCDYGVNETACMLVAIMSNEFLKFEIFEENLENKFDGNFSEDYGIDSIGKKERENDDEEREFEFSASDLRVNYHRKIYENNFAIREKAIFLYMKLLNFDQIFLSEKNKEDEKNLEKDSKEKKGIEKEDNYNYNNNIGRAIYEKKEKKVNCK